MTTRFVVAALTVLVMAMSVGAAHGFTSCSALSGLVTASPACDYDAPSTSTTPLTSTRIDAAADSPSLQTVSRSSTSSKSRRRATKGGRGADDVPASTPVGRSGMKGELNVTKPNAPAEIGGRQYSGHALDRMQGRGFTPSVVEDAIAHGRTAGGRTGSAIHYSPSNHLSVVVGRNGRVVTVSRGDLRPR